MKYDSVEHALKYHQTYPTLDKDLKDHEFQRRRVSSCVRFIPPGAKLLDVACNTGYFVDYVTPDIEVHGVDISEELAAIAKTRMKTVTIAPAEHLPFADGEFDVVNISGILEQVFDPRAVVREAARVCSRYLIGNTVHESGTWGRHRIERHSWQSQSYSEVEIRALLEDVGTIEHLGTIDVNTPPEPQCWFWCVRVVTSR